MMQLLHVRYDNVLRIVSKYKAIHKWQNNAAEIVPMMHADASMMMLLDMHSIYLFQQTKCLQHYAPAHLIFHCHEQEPTNNKAPRFSSDLWHVKSLTPLVPKDDGMTSATMRPLRRATSQTFLGIVHLYHFKIFCCQGNEIPECLHFEPSSSMPT